MIGGTCVEEIQYIKTEKTKSMEKKYYEGYNCILVVKKLLFDNNAIYFSLKHKDIPFCPAIEPVRSEEDFYFDFSKIIAGYKDFKYVRNSLTDIEHFCSEFLKRKEEFGFIKDTGKC